MKRLDKMKMLGLNSDFEVMAMLPSGTRITIGNSLGGPNIHINYKTLKGECNIFSENIIDGVLDLLLWIKESSVESQAEALLNRLFTSYHDIGVERDSNIEASVHRETYQEIKNLLIKALGEK